MKKPAEKDRVFEAPKAALTFETFKKLVAARELARRKAVQEHVKRVASVRHLGAVDLVDTAGRGCEGDDAPAPPKQTCANGGHPDAHANGAVPMDIDENGASEPSIEAEVPNERGASSAQASEPAGEGSPPQVTPPETDAEREARESAEADERARLQDARRQRREEREELRRQKEERRRQRETCRLHKQEQRRLWMLQLEKKAQRHAEERERLLTAAKQKRELELEEARSKKAEEDEAAVKAAAAVAESHAKLQELRGRKDALVLELKQITRAREAAQAREAAVLANLEEGERLPSPEPAPALAHAPPPAPTSLPPPPFHPPPAAPAWRPPVTVVAAGAGGTPAAWGPQASQAGPPPLSYPTPAMGPHPGSLVPQGPISSWMGGMGPVAPSMSHSGSSGGMGNTGGQGTASHSSQPPRSTGFSSQPFGLLSGRTQSLPPPPPPLAVPGPNAAPQPLGMTHNLPPHLRGGLRGSAWGGSHPAASSSHLPLPPHLAGANLPQGRPGIPPVLIPPGIIPNRMFGIPLPPPPPPPGQGGLGGAHKGGLPGRMRYDR